MTYHNQDTDRLFDAILSLGTREDCYAFFEDVCTVKETMDMAQRFCVAKMLTEGKSYTEITKETGMSTTTISRVNRCLKYGSGGYRNTLTALGYPPSPERANEQPTDPTGIDTPESR